MSSRYSNMIIQQRDVFTDIVEDINIINNRSVLSEIPDTLYKVNISGFTEKDYKGFLIGKKLAIDEFAVDYSLGIVHFSDSIAQNSSASCRYKGTGYIKYPASRIYFENLSGEYDDLGNIGAAIIGDHKFIFKNNVTNFADIATTYPIPEIGWTVQVSSTNNWYRYDTLGWIRFQSFNDTLYARKTNLALTDANVALKLDKASVTDNLTSSSPTNALSANQGKTLKGLVDGKSPIGHAHAVADVTGLQTTLNSKVNSTDVQDNLTSASTTKPLSANQGKVLKGLVDGFTSNLGNLSGLNTASKATDIVKAVNEVDRALTDLTINVKDIGAIGDGVADDHDAIQNALNVAKDTGSVKLYFPKGTYCVSDYLVLYKNTYVEMHPNAIIKRIGTTFKVFMNGEFHSNTYTGYNGEGNIHFVGGTIDLNQSTLPPTQTLSCFDLSHGENMSFTRLKIKNGQIGHYFQLSSVKNVRIRDCWLGDVVYSDTTSVSYECIQIEEATSTSFPTFGSYDQTPTRDIYIENCTFENVIRGIGTHSIAYNVPSENINIINNVIKNTYDNAISLWQYNNVTVENNYIIGCQFGINANVMNDSLITGNTILNAQKSGINLTSSNGNKFSKNVLKEVALSTTSSYAATRITSSNNNTFDDDSVTAGTPNYTYAWLSSGGCIGNKIISHRYTRGTSARIGGSDATEMANYQVGAGQDVLFDGDLASANATGTLTHDLRNYNFLVVMGNDNSSGTATLTSMVIPKAAVILGTATRFRLICDDTSSSDRVDFSFPSGTQIQVDLVQGTTHIRKVIGVV